MSGNPDGPGPRTHVLPTLPDALWYQTPTLGRHHTQGKNLLTGSTVYGHSVPLCVCVCVRACVRACVCVYAPPLELNRSPYKF